MNLLKRAQAKTCPKCGATASPHCNHCDLIKCYACKGYGQLDGKLWVPRLPHDLNKI